MPTPYEILGIQPDATPEEVKAAYRRAASRAHPDREDAEGNMAAINAAYELLSDPERRARFDATGAQTDGPTIEDEARTMLMQALASAIDSDANDPITMADRLMQTTSEQLGQHERTAAAAIKKLEKLAGRFKVKKGENLAQSLVETRLRDARTQQERVARGLKVSSLARVMLMNYSFDAPVVMQTYGASSTGHQILLQMQQAMQASRIY